MPSPLRWKGQGSSVLRRLNEYANAAWDRVAWLIVSWMGSENLTFPIAYVETAKAEHPATSFISEIRQVTCFYAVIIRSLSAVSEAPMSRELGLRRCGGTSDTATWRKPPPAGDYGICIWMSRSWSFASLPLRSECLDFSSGSQRERAGGGAWESLNRTTILRSDKCETQNRCARRSTSEIRAWRCGFKRRTGWDGAGIGEGVARRRDARQPAWFRRRADSSIVSERGVRPASGCLRWADRIAGAIGSIAEEVLLAVGWRGSQSCGCA